MLNPTINHTAIKVNAVIITATDTLLIKGSKFDIKNTQIPSVVSDSTPTHADSFGLRSRVRNLVKKIFQGDIDGC